MNVLLIGSGGREHALAWKLAQSPLLDKLYAAPGNPGIAAVAGCIALDVADHEAVARFCKESGIGLVVVGPEAPLVAGLADDLEREGITVFGPSKAAARLEGSKGFTKDLCARAGIPTGAYARFSDAGAAKAYLAGQSFPIVVKADGLAAGKGVIIAETSDDALAAIDACFGGAFGDAGAEVVIEEFLRGEEASFFALVDGTTAIPLADGAGPQARLRRRPGTEHRRHGRLCAGADHDRSPLPTHHDRDHRADGARACRRRHPVQGRALCRADDRRTGRRS